MDNIKYERYSYYVKDNEKYASFNAENKNGKKSGDLQYYDGINKIKKKLNENELNEINKKIKYKMLTNNKMLTYNDSNKKKCPHCGHSLL